MKGTEKQMGRKDKEMKAITIEQVQAQQKAAEKTRKRNGNRVQLWYNAESGQFMILELLGQDSIVNESRNNFRIPLDLNYMDFEKQADREADLLKRTKAKVDEINAYIAGVE